MLVSLYNQPQEMLVQTVSIHKNRANPLNLYLFRCPYCSSQISQVQGVVAKLSPGLMPSASTIVISQCHQCHMRFVFQETKLSGNDAEITLTSHENPLHIFRCYICRTALVKFSAHEVIQLSNMSRRSLPFGLTCYGKDCQQAYRFVDII